MKFGQSVLKSAKSLMKSISLIEILVLVIMVVYLVFPIHTPAALAPYVESPLGMISILLITIALFVYASPILAVLYVFVGYTLLRRSAAAKPIMNIPSVPLAPTHVEYVHEEVVQNVNMPPLSPDTLEEEVVAKMAPVGKGEVFEIVTTSFKPVATNVRGAAPV
jgi:hypothetical protein